MGRRIAVFAVLIVALLVWILAVRSGPGVRHAPEREAGRAKARTGDDGGPSGGESGTAMSPRPGDGPTLFVRVLDPEGGAIGGATVNGVLADADGGLRLPRDPALPSLELTGSAPGYPSQQLGRIPTWKRAVAVVLYPARAIAGRVVDQERRPVAGARVVLDENPWDDHPPVATVTGTDGGFSFADRAPRGWERRAHVAAFHESGAVVKRLMPLPGHGDAFLELQLDAAVRTVAGRVLDLHGLPLAGVAVTLATGGGGPQFDLGAKTTTDGDGRFAFGPRSLAELRQAEVFARKGGFGAGRVGVGRDGEEVVIRLAPYCRLRGRVLWADGSPVAAATVVATRAARRGNSFAPTLAEYPGFTAKTDAQGRFVFDELPAAVPDPRFAPEAHEQSRFRLIVQGIVPAPPHREWFVNAPSGKDATCELTLPRSDRVVDIAVLDPAGNPAPHTHVGIQRGEWFGLVRTDGEGRARARLYGDGDAFTAHLTSSRLGRHVVKDVAVADRIELRFATAPATIEGTVVDAQGAPLRGGHVWVDGTRDGTAVDPATGRFSLRVPGAGPWVLQVTWRGAEQRFGGMRSGKGARLVWQRGAGTDAELVVHLEGEAEGIAVLGLDSGLRRTKELSGGGRVVLRLPAGSYAVVGTFRAGSVASPRVEAPGEVRLALERASVVRGTLRCADARAFPCLLELRDVRTSALVGRWSVDSRGRVRGPGVGRGRYRARVIASRANVAYPAGRILDADGAGPLDMGVALVEAGTLAVSLTWTAAEVPRFLLVRRGGRVLRRIGVSGVELSGSRDVLVRGLAPGPCELELGNLRAVATVMAGQSTKCRLE